MKIRVFFSTKSFVDVECTSFTMNTRGVFSYVDKKMMSHTITGVIAVGSF